MFGPYIGFVARVKLLKQRFLFDESEYEWKLGPEAKKEGDRYEASLVIDKDKRMNLSKMNLVWYYIRNISPLRYFLSIHKRSE